MGFEVVGDAEEEHIVAEMGGKHTDDRAALKIADGVEDLVDFKRILDRHLDRMRVTDGIKAESCL